MKSFGYSIGDFIPCEVTGMKAVDIHHIESRGMGGDPLKNKDRIENLMAVTREVHQKYGDNPMYMVQFFRKHKEAMDASGVQYDSFFIEQKIRYYEAITQN